MLSAVKKRLYFVVAAYLGFWARIAMLRWKPRVIVVTGSTGKTSLLHLIEAQLGEKAFYSHHANSALGLPFLILGLSPNVESKYLWPVRLLLAPLGIFRRPPGQKLFVAEADCDRPREGRFLSKLLRPEVTLWVSVYRTHSMNFDAQVRAGTFDTHEEAIAHEFGYFAANTSKLVVANGDQPTVTKQLTRVGNGVDVQIPMLKDLNHYSITEKHTVYDLPEVKISLPGLHPKELGQSLMMVNALLDYLGLPLDKDYTKLAMPPGRSSVFRGQKDITIIDSTYNTGLGAMTAIIQLFADYPAKHKWLVLGDILEQGSLEEQEHEGLGRVIAEQKCDRVILLGPRTRKHTLPVIKEAKPNLVCESFESPKEVLDYLKANLQGGEAILFKGGRFLEGVIEQLLADPRQANELVRREAAWVKRRQDWGLPR